ncbi:hypothetical protein JHS3_03720 [Jeongeupia sp. HS-3]|uniref:site-specific DNA-methyltransferase n=1 Tax=Jeongeupia sp. HS-3 TaxID=1009682 RepID=UPI0018A4F86B|nr:site-specific DNA-methyltransferase [Jeongeupia sp. HS-3]BCL74636.1 hypothetical protein JHS3_03720 [Jeongeupia sp. HS-3]
MAVGLNKSELTDEAKLTVARDPRLSPALPPSNTKVSLSYPGKLSESDVLKSVSTRYKKLDGSSIIDVDGIGSNGFVWADNWFGLHSLLNTKTKAQLIYLDPPYATGYDFQSRGQEHAYNDSLGDAAYIEFMRRRLILLRELLDDTGSIYVHIGHQMVSELKMLLDEVFGKRNFRNLISRKKCSSKNFTKNQYSNMNDYVLFYTKSANYIWNRPSQKPDPEWIAKEYSKVDEKGQFKLVPIHAPGVRHGETGSAWRGMMPPPGKHWQYQPSKLDELDVKGEIHWSKTGNPRRKVYLTEDKSIGLSDYWDQYRDAHHQSILITGYPTEKNFDMLKMIVGASSNPGDLVIDPFCGSGSTLHAAEALGRRWIGIDQSFLAAKTVTERLLRGRKPMGDYVKRDGSLDLFPQISVTAQHEKAEANFNVYLDDEIASAYPTELSELSALLR